MKARLRVLQRQQPATSLLALLSNLFDAPCWTATPDMHSRNPPQGTMREA